MMERALFTGHKVRLSAIDPKQDAEHLARWSHDAGYMRLYGADPILPRTAQEFAKGLEKDLARKLDFWFLVRTLADDQPIGIASLDGIELPHREAWFSIGLGDRSYWGQGYGSDASQLMLAYGFRELNLHRISLTVFEYNQRAIRAYERLNFRHEGRARDFLLRDGRRWDMLFMGLLRHEWEPIGASR